MMTKSSTIGILIAATFLLPSLVLAQTAETWGPGHIGPDTTAKITVKGDTRIQVTAPVVVQGIEISGPDNVVFEGASITLGEGCDTSFNSIIVNSGDVTINNKLINTQNKRIALNVNGNSLTLNGDIDTGNQTTQIGNLGQGTVTLNGDRAGGNSLVIRDGTVIANGILSSTGSGDTQVIEGGVLVSSRKIGPTIQAGSFGLAIKERGVFRLAEANQIGSFLRFAGGKLEMGGFSNIMPVIGNTAVIADSVIDFSDPAAESLAFADVSANTTWKPGATLQIVGFTDGDTLRFGENANGLTKAQLDAIKFDGKPARIDADGYLTPAP